MAESTNTINSTEYEQFLAEKERVTKAMQAAESEFMFVTYNKMLAVLNKRHVAATRLNIVLSNKATRELAKQKRGEFKGKDEA